MSSPDYVYTNGLLAWCGWSGAGVYQLLLMTDAYLPDPDADVFVDDISADEYAAGLYTRQPITGDAITIVTGAQELTADDVVFDTDNDAVQLSTLVLAIDSGNDAVDLLLAGWKVSRLTDGTPFAPEFPPQGLVIFTTTPNCQDIPV